MSDQFNLYGTPEEIRTAKERLTAAYIDTPDRPIFFVTEMDGFLTLNLRPYEEIGEDAQCYFPHSGADPVIRYEDLVYQTGQSKSGCHDPQGMMLIHGNGINSGHEVRDVNNLDIAPTLLTLLGLPIPPEMTGRVMDQAFKF